MKKQEKVILVIFILALWMTSCTSNKTIMNNQWGVHSSEHLRNGGCGWAK